MRKKLPALLLCLLLLSTALSPCAYAYLHGDADLDGTLTAADARLVMRASVGLETTGSDIVPVADCDDDQQLTAADARLILRASVHLEELACHTFAEVRENGAIRTVCTVCGKDQRSVPAAPAELTQSLKEAADQISTRRRATAVQAAVIDNGCVGPCYTYGIAKTSPRTVVTEDTKFRVASLSKLAVAMVFMALSERGLVSDQTDIGEYLGQRIRNPYYPTVPITSEMLFTHTATFDDDGFYSYNLSALDMTAPYMYINRRPGTCYSYSNMAYGLIWCVCEKAAGQTFDALARQYLFDPLEIDAAFTASQIRAQSQLGALYGEDGGLPVPTWLAREPYPQLGVTLRLAAGNLGISAKDYAKLICVLLNGGRAPDGTQLLSQESVDTICRSHFTEPLYGVGYGTQIETTVLSGKTVIVHTGSAYGIFAAYAFCPAENKGVVALTTGCARSVDPASDVYRVCLELIRTLYPEEAGNRD